MQCRKFAKPFTIIFLCCSVFAVSAFDYPKQNCPFESRDVLSKQTVLSGDHANILINFAPSTAGHVMVIPKRCIENFKELTAQEINEVGTMIQLAAHAIENIYHTKDYIILQKNGVGAGQSVQHLHAHVIPIFKGEKLLAIKKTFNLIDREKLSPAKIEKIVNQYRSYFFKFQNKYWPHIQIQGKQMEKKSYSHVLLDLGNVLIKAQPNETQTLAQSLNITAQQADQAILGIKEYRQYCLGKITSDDYYQAVIKQLININDKIKLSKQQLKDLLDSHILDYDNEVLSLVKDMKQMGKKIIIVTDTHQWQSQSFRNRIDFDNYADAVFESHIIGKLKDDPDYFKMILQKLNIDGKSAILIDDKLINNVLAAKQNIYSPGFISAKQIRNILIANGYL